MENVINNIILEDIMEDEVDIHEIILHAAASLPNLAQNAPMDGLDEALLLALEDDDGFEMHLRGDRPVSIENYYEEVIPQYTDEQFHSHFRMTRQTLAALKNVIEQLIPEQENFPLEKKILLTIWVLATPDSFRSVSDRFGLAPSIAYLGFKQIVIVLRNHVSQYVRWPTEEECLASDEAFSQRIPRFRGVIGAIDGTHIQIRQPPGNAHDFYNRHGTCSVVLQGTCDHSGKFIDVLIGRPGRAHDAAILRSSSLFERITDVENPLIQPNRHILGDSAYPLLLNLLTPFRDNGHLTARQIQYNNKHAVLRSIIERAFGLLKCKFRRLILLDVKSVGMANNIIAASVVLYNFLILNGEININEPIHRQTEEGNGNEEEHNENEDLDGRQKRDNIMNIL